jgi:RNA polymerase sigma factor (sigma-70 family)
MQFAPYVTDRAGGGIPPGRNFLTDPGPSRTLIRVMKKMRASEVPNNAEFEALFGAHHRAIHRYVLRRLESEGVEDAVAETFVTAWRRWAERPGEEDQLLWLYGIARRTVANFGRGNGRRIRLMRRLANDRTTEGTERQQQTQLIEELLDGIEQLAPNEREILRLAYWERLSHREMAQVLGCSENAVGLRIARIRRALNRKLAKSQSNRIERIVVEL